MSQMIVCTCDQGLLNQMQSTNPADRQQGWEAWYQRDASTLQNYIERRCQILGCREHSEDILQDTFVIGFRNISSGHFKDQGKALRAYLYGIARNLIYDVARRQCKETLYEIDFDAPTDDIIGPDDRIELEKILTSVSEAYRQSPTRYSRVITGLYVQEKTSQELSLELGKSATNIRALAHRGIQGIEQYLAGHYGVHLSSDAIRLCLKML